jgi:hypothetical protein
VLEFSSRAIGMEKFKLSWFADNCILKIPKDSTKMILDMINTFGKVAEHNINIKISGFSIYQN